MDHSPAGSSDLFMILSFSTLYASFLWRSETIVSAELISSLSQISSPPLNCVLIIIKDFNKQNCLPLNKLNINDVTKNNLRF